MQQQFRQQQQSRQWHREENEEKQSHLSSERMQSQLSLAQKHAQVTGTKKQGSGQGLGLRPPDIDEDGRRLVVAVSNDPEGNVFLDSLREEDTQSRLGFRFVGTLGEMLNRFQVNDALLADELSDKFAFLEILPGYEFPVVNGILRQGCDKAKTALANIDVEGDLPMSYSLQQGLGPNYVLQSSGSFHNQYLNKLNVPSYRSASGVKIAVVDSGFEKTGVLQGFFDLVDPNNTVEVDKFGHGTAMATIIADAATGADVYSVRASDQGPRVSEAMLGVSAASFHFQPDIINLSFGLSVAKTCSSCGATVGGVSRVLNRLLDALSNKPVGPGGPPILVAATGNNGVSTGFDAPAEWNFTVAVGSINSSEVRSSFSNYGTTGHAQYIMMPGGDENSAGSAIEWIGEATYKCYGTSPAAAYASGVLALYLANPKYSGLSRSAFLSQVLANCQPCTNQNAAEHGLGYLPYK